MTFYSLFHLTASAIKVVELKDNVKDIYLYKDHLEIVEDVNGQWTIDTIVQSNFNKFLLNTEEYRYVENHSSTYWIHIKVNNRSSVSTKWIFEVLSLHTHDLQLFYKVKDHYEMKQTGEAKPFSQREYKVKNFTFDLPFEANKEYDVYVRVKSQNDAGFEYKIRSQHYFTWYTTHEYLYLGIYYGLLVFLIIYNLFLFISSLDKIYIFYALYLLGCSLVSFSEDGLCFEFFWPNHPAINLFVDEYCEQIFLVFTLTHFYFFLPLDQEERSAKWHRHIHKCIG